jgi:glucose/arabinose dehydrogenase
MVTSYSITTTVLPLVVLLFCIINYSVCATTLYRVNCGSDTSYQDTHGHVWAADQYYSTSVTTSTMNATIDTIKKTQDPTVYATGRELTDKKQKVMTYEFTDLEDGQYVCSLMFMEAWVTSAGKRTFDVLINKKRRYSALDIYKQVGSKTALAKRFYCSAKDGVINIQLRRVAGNPRVSAIEIRKVPVDKDACLMDCGKFSCCRSVCYDETKYTCLSGILCQYGSQLCGGTTCYDPDTQECDSGSVIDKPLPSPSPEPQPVNANAGADVSIVDVNGDGSEGVTLDGSASSAVPPATIASYEWSLNGKVLSNDVKPTVTVPVGVNDITLTVTDSEGQVGTDSVQVIVLSMNEPVAGLDGYYYIWRGIKITSTMNKGPWTPVYGQLETDAFNTIASSNFRGTAFITNFAAFYKGYLQIPTDGDYTFAIESDEGSYFHFNNDQLVIDNGGFHTMQKISNFLPGVKKGLYPVEFKMYNSENNAGLKIYWTRPGAAEEIIPASAFFHYLKDTMPVVHSLSAQNGPVGGGNTVTIKGYGFVFPTAQTKVFFGDYQCTNFRIVDTNTIEAIVPAAVKEQVFVSVTTPVARSGSLPYEYNDAAIIPIQFSTADNVLLNIGGPTCLEFGPDGKLYIGSTDGSLTRVTLDDNSKVVDKFTSNIFAGKQLLGIAFNPRDTDVNNIRVYVSYNVLYQAYTDNGSDQRGGVSIVSGANLDIKQDIITGLFNSERDHGINGLNFMDDGRLMILAGSNTNGGLPGALQITLKHQEKELTCAVLVADVSKGGFDGNVKYAGDDGFAGQQISGLDVQVYATGLKNAYSAALHSNGRIYTIDNGPSQGLGQTSTSCTTAGPDPGSIDKLHIVEEGRYYGAPNRARGNKDPRQCVYRWFWEADDGYYRPPIYMLPSSMDGIVEYTVNTFDGKLRGHLIMSRLMGELWDATLSDDGLSVVGFRQLSQFGGLSTVMNSDGSMISADYYNNMVYAVRPVEPAKTAIHVLSVTPNRGLIAGGNSILIRGSNFVAPVTVSLDGQDCAVTEVSATKIRCNVPAGAASKKTGITVNANGQSYTLPNAYRYMKI